MVSLLTVYKTEQVKAENWDVLVSREGRANKGPIAGLGQCLPVLCLALTDTVGPSCLQTLDPLHKGKRDV